ncbi:hypothetical protein IC582_022888 [Cucumis melo]
MKSMRPIRTITLEKMSRVIKSTVPTTLVTKSTLSGRPFHYQPISLRLIPAFLSAANAVLSVPEVEPFVCQNREASNQSTTLSR